MTTPPQAPSVTYARFRGRFGVATVLSDVAPLVRGIIERSTLYDYAADQMDRRVFMGRGPVYGVALNGQAVVVRRVRHGGLLRWMGDVFIGPTRAHYELAVALQLRAYGVLTPEVVGYIRYDAGPFLRRVDVITREVTNAIPLEQALVGAGQGPGDARARPARASVPDTSTWTAVTALCQALAKAGAYHRDLNVRNVLLTTEGAWALDVDRVVWGVPGDPALAQANIRRLQRSARKLGLL